jgi:hypothetical protein
MIGLGGNNASTLCATILANRHNGGCSGLIMTCSTSSHPRWLSLVSPSLPSPTPTLLLRTRRLTPTMSFQLLTRPHTSSTFVGDIRKFKKDNGLDRVVVFWTANTERYSDIIPGVNDTADNLLAFIKVSHSEVSPPLSSPLRPSWKASSVLPRTPLFQEPLSMLSVTTHSLVVMNSSLVRPSSSPSLPSSSSTLVSSLFLLPPTTISATMMATTCPLRGSSGARRSARAVSSTTWLTLTAFCIRPLGQTERRPCWQWRASRPHCRD